MKKIVDVVMIVRRENEKHFFFHTLSFEIISIIKPDSYRKIINVDEALASR